MSSLCKDVICVVSFVTMPILGKLEPDQSAEVVLKKALRYRPYWKDNGGITVSGGEPLLQIDFLIELFTLAKKEGVNTVLDTCGQPFTFEEPFFSKFKLSPSILSISFSPLNTLIYFIC